MSTIGITAFDRSCPYMHQENPVGEDYTGVFAGEQPGSLGRREMALCDDRGQYFKVGDMIEINCDGVVP